MKIFVDENIPLMTVRALRGMGHGRGWSITTQTSHTPEMNAKCLYSV